VLKLYLSMILLNKCLISRGASVITPLSSLWLSLNLKHLWDERYRLLPLSSLSVTFNKLKLKPHNHFHNFSSPSLIEEDYSNFQVIGLQ
jgi:hypothetical protein